MGAVQPPAATAFELAHYPDLSRERFAEATDLLLDLPMGCDGEATSLILCGRGVMFRKRLMTDRSVPIAVWPRVNSAGGGYEMTFGTSRLAFVESPGQTAGRLACWAEYWFAEFVPHVGDALATPAGPAAARLLRPLATACPACDTPVISVRVGAVGVRVAP